MAERIQIPNEADLTGKLQAHGILGLTPQSDRFYRKVVALVADKEIGPEEMNAMWEQAHETFGQASPLLHQLVDMEFDYVVSIISPDQDITERAINYRREFLSGKMPQE